MRKLLTLVCFVAAAIVLASPTPAQAQINHTWVSSTGSDSANCDRPTPCQTFNGAYGKTNAGGEITCVDGGNYGGLTISHSTTINCEAAIGSNSFSGGTTVGSIFISGTATTDVVALRGLDLDGDGIVGGPGGLVNFIGAGTLRLEKMKVSNIHGIYNGVLFAPSGTAKLQIVDSIIANNGSSGVTAGITIKPASGVTANVAIERSAIENNLFGIVADGSSGGTIHGIVTDSFVTGNINNGVTVSTTGSNVVLMIESTKIANNSFGLVASGANAGMLVRNSIVTANATGLFASSSGVLLSYKDNSVNGNTSTDGSFTGGVVTQ